MIEINTLVLTYTSAGQARLDEEDSNGCFKNLGAKCRSYKIMKKQPPEDFRLKTANLDSVRWAQLFLHLWKKMFFFVLKISNGTSQTVFFQSASDPILILSLCVFLVPLGSLGFEVGNLYSNREFELFFGELLLL